MTSRNFNFAYRSIISTTLILFTLSCASTEKAPRTGYKSVVENYNVDAEAPAPANLPNLTNSTFDWPVDEARLTRGYKTTPTGKRRKPHLGIDLAAPKGTPIIASHSGIVIYAGRDFRGYGRMVMVEGKKGFATLYAHLDRIYVSEGQKVVQGETIGGMGRTGRASGVHLHFEIRGEEGPVDPLEHLPNGQRYAHLLTANHEIKDNFKN